MVRDSTLAVLLWSSSGASVVLCAAILGWLVVSGEFQRKRVHRMIFSITSATLCESLGYLLSVFIFGGVETPEGVAAGLGLIPGVVRRLPVDSPIGPVRIPHMGWSRLEHCRPHGLTEGIGEDARFYFVHSYVAVPDDDCDIIGVSTHGSRFVSAVARQNVLGVQFHPEKSHRYGKALLGNFLQGF